jgi:terminase small subunit-like protein
MPGTTRLRSVPCTARSSRTGEPCRKRAIMGATVCRTHGGASPQVKAKAAQRVKDMLADAIDPDRVLREAARLAYSDIRELFDEQGNLLPIKKWPDDIAKAVASIEFVKKNVTAGDGKVDDVIKLRLWDKPRKLENLMKHHGQLTEKLEVSGELDIVERLAAGRKRVADAREKR